MINASFRSHRRADRLLDRRCNHGRTRPAYRFAMLVTLLLCILTWPAVPARGADDDLAPRADAPLADPVVDADADFSALRVTSWHEGAVHMLLLEGDVKIAVGTYGFRADRAVVRIDTEQRGSVRIQHLAMYLDKARTLQGRGPTGAEAPRLLVTASTRGQLNLSTDLLREVSAAANVLVIDATERIDKYLRALQEPLLDVPEGPPLHRRLTIQAEQRQRPALKIKPVKQVLPRVQPPNFQPPIEDQAAAGDGTVPPSEPVGKRPEQGPTDAGGILPSAGVVSFSVKKAVYRKSEKGEAVLVLIGDVHVVYHGTAKRKGVSLSADNAVIFLRDDFTNQLGNQIDASAVRGVYLEDNVIARYGDYTVRAPRVYYDLELDRAVVLDAVMYTWDVQRQIPIYVRAEKLMQLSRTAWQGERVLLTTSDFAEPHFAIAARTVTVTQGLRPDGSSGHRFVSQDNQMRWGKLPVFYWPRLAGQVQDLPIRRLDGAYDSQSGPVVRSSWDLFALAGKEKPDGVKLTGQIDGLGDHGPAIGAALDYDRPEMFGSVEGYLIFQDEGLDEIANRIDIDHDGDTRGFIKAQHRQYLNNEWELSAEIAFVSDETFLEAFFKDEAQQAKPYETSLYLQKQGQDWATTLLVSHELNNFTPQTTTLQSPGYAVEKTPELGYWNVGKSLWQDRLTYYGQSHISRMRIAPGKDTPADRGLNATISAMLFGIAPTVRFDMAPGAAATESGYLARFDSRHEIQAPLKVLILDVVPYLAARVTAYDDDPLAGNDEDNARFWTAAGVRMRTNFSRTFDKAASSILNIHRLRHVIEPSLDLYVSDASINTANVGLFDPDVEGINQGSGIIVAVRNTLQTQRGGPGRWRTVDWLVLDTRVAWRDNEEPHTFLIPRYFGYRPEYSIGGDHANAELMWWVSDALAAVGEATYDLDADVMAQWRAGMSLRQSPQLTLFADFAELDQLSSRLLSYGLDYRLTPKYTVSFNHRMDLSASGDRSIDLAVIRQLPRWKLVFLARIDELDDRQTFGIVLVPDGLGGSRYRNLLTDDPIF